jgi:anti-sigma regulatory factor (Ser/Thr protein kinase)
MTMDIGKLILKRARENGSITVREIAREAGFSRAYVHRFFQVLRQDGALVLIGKANRARYFLPDVKNLVRFKQSIQEIHKVLKNRGLEEDVVLDQIKSESGVWQGLRANVARIVDYAFTEMMNNAIDHSGSASIRVRFKRSEGEVRFTVTDRGVGIFRNIMKQRRLASELEALQDLIKGKQTTDPSRHSGEGIFFTSRVADKLVIKGSSKKLTFDNAVPDVFVEETPRIKGTEVQFTIQERSRRQLQNVFAQYAGDAFEFSKTVVTVELFRTKGTFLSRSEARRILSGLDKFKTVVFDFASVRAIGQAFADEVFRVWQSHHPSITIEARNANESIRFMIQHSLNG